MSHDRLKANLGRIGHVVSSLLTGALLGLLLLFLFVSASLQSPSDSARQILSWSTLALPWLMLALAGWLIWRRIGFRILFGAILCSGAVLGYLAWDDTVRPPPPTAYPIVSDKSPSYVTYRWFLKDDKESRLTAEYSKTPDLPIYPANSADWTDFVSAHRQEFEEAWATDSLGREWVDAMALHAPEGLYPPPSSKGPNLKFTDIRRSCFARWGVAQLRHLEGKPDEAVSLLLPLVRAMYHMQQGATTMVTQMIAIVCLRGTYTRLDLVLNNPKLSDEKRREIVGALKQAPSVDDSIRNAYLGERFIAHSSTDEIENHRSGTMEMLKYLPLATDSELPRGISIVAPLLLNRNRAEREYLDFLDRVTAMSLRREVIGEKIAVAKFQAELEQWRFKNPIGGMFAAFAFPAFAKIMPQLWQLEDQRVALLRRLKA